MISLRSVLSVGGFAYTSILSALLFLVIHPTAAIARDFIPLEDLMRSSEGINIKISPTGEYIVGLQERRVDAREGFERTWAVFTMDLQTKETFIISSGRIRGGTGLNPMVNYYEWIGPKRLILRDQISGDLFAMDYNGENEFIILDDPYRYAEPRGRKRVGSVLRTDQATSAKTVERFHLQDANVIHTLPHEPEHVLLWTMNPGERVYDRTLRGLGFRDGVAGIWKVNTLTGEYTHVAKDPYPTGGWLLNAEGDVVMALANPQAKIDQRGEIANDDYKPGIHGSPRNYLSRYAYVPRGNQWEKLSLPVSSDPIKPDSYFNWPHLSTDQNNLYFICNYEHDLLVLKKMDLTSGHVSIAHEPQRVDVSAIIQDPWSKAAIGFIVNDGRPSYHYLDEDLAKVQRMVERLLPKDRLNRIINWSENRRRFIVRSYASDLPPTFFFLDLDAKRLEEIYNPFEHLLPYEFNRMEPVDITARDGTAIPSYLTKPSNPDAKAPYPTMILVHGGPQARDSYGYNMQVQFYADRGYAVLQVNYRGSTGYGRAWMNAGRKEFGGLMQDDVTDATRWLIDQGIADPDRVGITGWSYGAYATMMGLIQEPDLYSVGIAGAGVYDLPLQILDEESLRDEDFRILEYRQYWIGDPETELDELKAVSPVYHAHKIKDPVFLTHGHDDTITRINQGFEMSRALKRANREYETHFERYDGHGYAEEENRFVTYAKIEDFLRRHMPSDLM